MLTAGANALAMARFGVLRLMHSGSRDGFTFLMAGLAAIAIGIWAAVRWDREEPAKN